MPHLHSLCFICNFFCSILKYTSSNIIKNNSNKSVWVNDLSVNCKGPGSPSTCIHSVNHLASDLSIVKIIKNEDMNNKHAVCTRICCLLLKYWTKYTYVCSYIGQACVVHVNHMREDCINPAILLHTLTSKTW